MCNADDWQSDPRLTTVQAARMLEMDPKTLGRWRSEGKGPEYVRWEGRIYYRRSAVLRFMRGG